MTVQDLLDRLRLPVIAAPMFLVSGTDLLLACCKAGVVGSLPADNARTTEQLAAWLGEIDRELYDHQIRTGKPAAPWALNVIVMDVSSQRFIEEMRLVEQFKPPIVITSFGQPGTVAEVVHGYGGLVFHDISTLRHAEKAIAAGVDGLIVLTSGAGGHTGSANPFAIVPQVRKIWNGAILLAGAISDGQSIYAAQALGADFAYMGTRFAATKESMANENYRNLLISEQTVDVLTTDRVAGVQATFLKGSISRAGLDPENLPPHKAHRTPDLPDGIKPWRDIWSAGHGVGLINDIPSVEVLVERLMSEYKVASLNMKAKP